MKPILNVYALPRFVEPEELAGGTAVVIDILRATTTIAYALEAGAVEVIPCLQLTDALAAAKQFSPDEIVLGGERDGVAIEGFDLGNSPEEYSSDRVAGKTVIFTTTNGTRAMTRTRSAKETFVASFVNLSAVVSQLILRENIHVLCAGTDGAITEEDILFAGLLADQIIRRSGVAFDMNAQAVTAREFWLNAFTVPQTIGAEPLEPDRLAEHLRKSLGAQNLIRLGMDDDIFAASQIDRFDSVPVLDTNTFRIHRLPQKAG
jgi:2-phosphosulfolactate phosphatase